MNISVQKLIVQLPQVRKNNRNNTVKFQFGEILAYDVANIINMNDYIIIEGYISLEI